MVGLRFVRLICRIQSFYVLWTGGLRVRLWQGKAIVWEPVGDSIFMAALRPIKPIKKGRRDVPPTKKGIIPLEREQWLFGKGKGRKGKERKGKEREGKGVGGGPYR